MLVEQGTQYAGEELARELYELSGWEGDAERRHEPKVPYYSLGYLMRKLPDDDYELFKNSSWLMRGMAGPTTFAGTPEDAAAKLAIELFKQGILKKEDV